MNKRGFSLAELLTIISIIGILGGIAVPTIMTLVPNFRLKEGAREVYSALQQAKLEAVRRNKTVTLSFTTVSCGTTPAGGEYKLTYEGNAGPVMILQGSAPAHVGFCQTTFPNNAAKFKKNGLPAAPGSVSLKNTKNLSATVVLSKAGAVRVENN